MTVENIVITMTQGSTPSLLQDKGDAYCLLPIYLLYEDSIVHHAYAAHDQTVNQLFYLKVLRLFHGAVRHE
jgi:hypothetical protein